MRSEERALLILLLCSHHVVLLLLLCPRMLRVEGRAGSSRQLRVQRGCRNAGCSSGGRAEAIIHLTPRHEDRLSLLARCK